MKDNCTLKKFQDIATKKNSICNVGKLKNEKQQWCSNKQYKIIMPVFYCKVLKCHLTEDGIKCTFSKEIYFNVESKEYLTMFSQKKLGF